jgi:probable rRNA maturation factor
VSVEVRSDLVRGRAEGRRLGARAREFLTVLGHKDAHLSLLIVGDEAMRGLNRIWRGEDRTTDVISFPQSEPNDGTILGDVALSLDTAERRAKVAGRTVDEELDRYLAHGILHLLGYDHLRTGEARRMAEAEAKLVGEGLVPPAVRSRPLSRRGRPGGHVSRRAR